MIPLTPAELIAQLETHAPRGPFGIALDGDGTLWQGDVGEDVFNHYVRRELILEPALPALRVAARSEGLDASGSASQLASRIFSAYLAGRFSEHLVCEIMTWCYAGRSLAELAELAREALAEAKLEARLNPDLKPVLEWAREKRGRVLVVSASPRFVVEQAAALWRVTAEDVAAGEPLISHGRVAPGMARPLPYADEKRVRGQALLNGADWLASFGDSRFDLEMLKAARFAVGVHAKPELADELCRLDGAFLLGTPR